MQITKNAFIASLAIWFTLSSVASLLGASVALPNQVVGGLVHVMIVIVAFEVFTKQLVYRAISQIPGFVAGMWVATQF